MLSEFQSYSIGTCAGCGADAIYCEDWLTLEWQGGDADCVHSLDAADFEHVFFWAKTTRFFLLAG